MNSGSHEPCVFHPLGSEIEIYMKMHAKYVKVEQVLNRVMYQRIHKIYVKYMLVMLERKSLAFHAGLKMSE